jgi:hypothetical protein
MLGLIILDPEAATTPTSGFITTELAPGTFQVNVAELPAVMVAGVMSKDVMVGANAVQPAINIIDMSGIKSNFFIDILPTDFNVIVAWKV